MGRSYLPLFGWREDWEGLGALLFELAAVPAEINDVEASRTASGSVVAGAGFEDEAASFCVKGNPGARSLLVESKLLHEFCTLLIAQIVDTI